MNPSYSGSKQLTPQQLNIIGLIAIGDSNGEIGSKLHISEDTVKTHIRRLCKVWNARNRAHCVHLAYQYGILVLGAEPPAVEPPAKSPPKVERRDPLAATFTRVGLIHRAAAVA